MERRYSVLAKRDYELLFIVNPELSEEDREVLLGRVRGYLEEGKGSIFRFDPWGLRRLAYRLNRHREGYYYLIQFTMDSENVKAFEHNLLLAEGVLREIIVRLEEVQSTEKSKPQAQAPVAAAVDETEVEESIDAEDEFSEESPAEETE